MTTKPNSTSDGGLLGHSGSRSPSSEERDLSGKARLRSNVLWSWGGQLIFIVSGFVMPHVIDRSVGQVGLGIWDFSWSMVSYFSLAGLGIGSSVNRYVAKYRAEGDSEGLCRAVSSVHYVQLVMGGVAFLLTLGTGFVIPVLFREKWGFSASEASWVMWFLGTTFAVQLAFDSYRGVITGCHRWDLHNGLNASCHGITTLGMLAALVFGGGLRSLAGVTLGVALATELIRVRVAKRVCPEVRISRSLVGFGETKRMLTFGVKRLLAGLPQILVAQGASIVVAGHLGPAALAVLARPNGLVRQVQTLIDKFALVLTPTAGSMQAFGQEGEVRSFLLSSARAGVLICLPAVISLGFLGDSLLHLWMGSRYVEESVVAILCVGAFLPMAQQSVISVLIGLNRHGSVGIATCVVTGLTFGAGVFAASVLGWSIAAGAWIIAVSSTVGIGLVVPTYVCMQMRIDWKIYLAKVFLSPVIRCIPLVVTLEVVRSVYGRSSLEILMVGSVAGGGALLAAYWGLLPPRMRQSMGSFFRFDRYPSVRKRDPSGASSKGKVPPDSTGEDILP